MKALGLGEKSFRNREQRVETQINQAGAKMPTFPLTNKVMEHVPTSEACTIVSFEKTQKYEIPKVVATCMPKLIERPVACFKSFVIVMTVRSYGQ